MSHVLLSGTPGSIPDLRAMLQEWGLTVADLAPGRPAWPDVATCDLVLHVGTVEGIPGAMPDGAQEAGGAVPGAAPLLVLGSDRPVPQALETLADPGPGGVLLREAVARAVRWARKVRGPDGDRGRAEALQFLGHELRSPLAAVKTALDILAREKDLAPELRRLVDLASRNADRLADTVDWSQEMRDLEEAPPELDLRPVSPARLAASLPPELRPSRIACPGEVRILTDPAPLAVALGQLARVVAVACPEDGVDVRLEGGAGEAPLRLVLAAGGPARSVGGLMDGGRPDDPDAVPPLEKLVRAMCTRDLLAGLGLRPRALDDPGGRCGLVVDLPVVVPAPASC